MLCPTIIDTQKRGVIEQFEQMLVESCTSVQSEQQGHGDASHSMGKSREKETNKGTLSCICDGSKWLFQEMFLVLSKKPYRFSHDLPII
jgi:hypothetical protein